MATNGYKINKSINLNPQTTAPVSPTSGDMYYDATIGSFVYYGASAWANFDSIGSVVSADSMTSSLFTPAVVQNSVVRLTGEGGMLHGMSASFTAKRLIVYNNTGGSVTIMHDSVSELTSNNRIITPVAGNMTLVAGEVSQFIYDSTQSRWLLVSVGSGAGAYSPATTTNNGIVRLNRDPVNASAPEVVVTDASSRAVAQGLTRGSYAAGAVAIGTGTNDSSVTIGKVGATTTVAGNAVVDGTMSVGSGGPTLVLKAGTADHTYMELYARTTTPAARSAFFGFGNTGETDLALVNSIGSVVINTTNASSRINIGTTGGAGVTLGRTGATTVVNDNVSVPATANYTFATAQTRVLNMSAMQFIPSSLNAWGTVGIGLRGAGACWTNLNANLFSVVGQADLPPGAIINKIEILVWTASTADPRFSIKITSVTRTTTGNTEANVHSGIKSFTLNTMNWYELTPLTNTTVPNDGYIAFGLSGYPNPDNVMEFYGFRVTYTVTKL